MRNESSGTNTVLLVIIILILLSFGIWWLAAHNDAEVPSEVPPRNDAVLNADIEGEMSNDNDAGGNGSNPNNP